MPITTCIFDMDGVLLDSEPFWRQAEREVFATVDVHLTEQDCIDTMGIRIDEVVALRYSQKPWDSPHQDIVAQRIVARVAEIVTATGRPLPGVHEAIAFLRQQNLALGLATSSSSVLVEATLSALGLSKAFDCVHSAEHEPYGKPHPAVYLHTAAKMGANPLECLAIEDSLTGVISAKAARMQVIAVPEAAVAQDPRFTLADFRLSSLIELPSIWPALLKQS